MQSYESFKTQILERFTAAFPDADVHVSPVTKNNGTVLDGLVVMAPGSNISPTLYLEQIYEIYRDSGDFEAIWQDLYAVYEKYGRVQNVSLDFLTDFEQVKSCLFCRLVSAERNRELLSGIPHRRFLDLAVIYYIGISWDGQTRGSILVTNQQAADWGVTQDELEKIALENNRTKFPAELISLSSFLSEENSGIRPDESDPVPLYILTNSVKFYGASALLDDELLHRFAEDAGDFYILPSSLHEVLLIAADSAPEPEILNEIIRDVNSSHLDPTDILSDHLYTYSASAQCIS